MAGEVCALARHKVDLLLKAKGTSLDDVIRDGGLEPALFMVYVGARNTISPD